MSIYIALWDCPVCSHVGNLGPHTNCAACGAPRPKNVQFYLPENPIIVENEADLEKAKAGADWICGHCEAHNKAWETVCRACGNPRDEASADINISEKEYAEGEVPTTGKVQRPLNSNELAHYGEKNLSSNKRLLWIIPIVVVIIALFLVFWKTDTEVSIIQFEWQRETDMLHYEIADHEDWNLPSEAKNVRQFQAIHHYNKVFVRNETRYRSVQVPAGTEQYVCGKISKGNGYFEDQYCTRTIYESKQESYQEPIYQDVPIYATKYQYKIWEWVKKSPIQATAKNQSPQWAKPSFSEMDKWKEGDKREKYWVYVKDRKEGIHKEVIPYSLWQKYKVNDKVPALEQGVTGNYKGLNLGKEGRE